MRQHPPGGKAEPGESGPTVDPVRRQCVTSSRWSLRRRITRFGRDYWPQGQPSRPTISLIASAPPGRSKDRGPAVFCAAQWRTTRAATLRAVEGGPRQTEPERPAPPRGGPFCWFAKRAGGFAKPDRISARITRKGEISAPPSGFRHTVLCGAVRGWIPANKKNDVFAARIADCPVLCPTAPRGSAAREP